MATANIRGITYSDLESFLMGLGEKRFRAEQIFRWIHRPIQTFDEMTDVNKKLRQQFTEFFNLDLPALKTVQISRDGTRKYLFLTQDDQSFEAVYIPEVASGSNTHTLCVSSQTGCSVGCSFCFTASIRHYRNLSAAEIIGQVHVAMMDIAKAGAGSIKNIVFMGMGEPLLNYDQVLTACRILIDTRGLSFSPKRVTVSTAGIVPNLIRLGHDCPVQIALSLHAGSDEVRSQIVPINRKWGVTALIQALKNYPIRHKQKFIIEYVLLKGINDSVEEARRLAHLLRGVPCKINLLPLNAHERTAHQTPAHDVAVRFQNELRKAGYLVFVRTARGQDISAACGQLGGSHAKTQTPDTMHQEALLDVSVSINKGKESWPFAENKLLNVLP